MDRGGFRWSTIANAGRLSYWNCSRKGERGGTVGEGKFVLGNRRSIRLSYGTGTPRLRRGCFRGSNSRPAAKSPDRGDNENTGLGHARPRPRLHDHRPAQHASESSKAAIRRTRSASCRRRGPHRPQEQRPVSTSQPAVAAIVQILPARPTRYRNNDGLLPNCKDRRIKLPAGRRQASLNLSKDVPDHAVPG